MSDNIPVTPGSGADVSTDVVTLLNGEVVSPVHVQRVKVGYGVDGEFIDAKPDTPFPVSDTQLADVAWLLGRMLTALNAPQGYDKSLQRQRGTIVVESGTVTTVSTVTNLSQIDGLQPRIQIYGANLSAWADTVRARIT